MIGRKRDLQKLKEGFETVASCYPAPQPCKAGEGKYRQVSQVFGITGDAGIGKSRLALEFKVHLEHQLGQDGFRWLAGGAWSIGRTPLYLPVKMQIASALGFDAAASRKTIADALSTLRHDAGDNTQLLPYLFHLFGLEYPDSPLSELEPKSVKDNLWVAIRRLYVRWSLQKPLGMRIAFS